MSAVWYAVLECLVACLSVVINCVVVIAVVKNRPLHSPPNLFTCSLALADVTVGLWAPSTAILSYYSAPRHFVGCVFVHSAMVLVSVTAKLALDVLLVDRFLTICAPLRYRHAVSEKGAMWIMAASWMMAFAIGCVHFAWNKGQNAFRTCHFSSVIDIRYLVFSIFLLVTVPSLLLMFCTYPCMYLAVRKHVRRMEGHTITRHSFQLPFLSQH